MAPSRSRCNQPPEKKTKIIPAICWIPKGAFKNVRFATEPPTKEEIGEALRASVALDQRNADSNYDDDDMSDDNADGDQEEHGVLQPEGVAKALSKDKPADGSLDYIDAAMRDLNMDQYDTDEERNGDLYYPSNDMDPYLKNDDMSEEEEEEEEDRTVKPNDLIIASLHVHEKTSGNYLKVFILEELMDGDQCMGWSSHKIQFVHPPLCLAWSGCRLNKDDQEGNFMAVGTMSTEIEIWDLDLVDALTPRTVLGGNVKQEKVQVVSWSQHSPEIILSGSFDKSVALVGLKNGMVQAFDKRKSSSNDQSSSLALFTLHAHEKIVTSISFGPSAPNFLATSSTDKTVKLWDTSSNQPSCIASLNPKLGAIFSVSFSNDNPFLLAMGGSKGNIKISDTLAQTSVANRFGRYGGAKSC
nr:unnamed protein product [Digitaria exilis]